jgi:hypothetical protein
MSRLCRYERTGPFSSGEWPYRCNQCGHERRSKYPPDKLKRSCPATQRKAIEADIASDPQCTRPMSEIKAFVDICFGGCRYMKRHCIRWSTNSQQEQIQLWVEHVYDGDCDQFAK